MGLRRRSYLVEVVETDTWLLIESKKKTGLQKFKERHGIEPCGEGMGVGFSEKEQKYYGWSHRAIYGFGIGHTVKEGHMPTKYVGQTAKTLEDCKKFAKAFASEVG